MDGWGDEDGFRIARDLHGGAGVSAAQTSATANGAFARAPMAALDALIETAWSFPHCRVSYGAFDGPRAIRFHTSAGSESQAALDGVRIDLSSAPRLLEELRGADVPVAFEDVEADSRLRPIAPALVALGARSVLILPVRREREAQPFGIVMMDRDKPRTWGPKEGAALDRMGPLIALTLEYVETRAELESRRSSASQAERRVTAMRGLIAGVASDAQRILGAIQATAADDDETRGSLLGHLERLIDDLDRVQHGPSRLTHPFDLAPVIHELAPGLGTLTPANIRIDGFSDGLIGVQANRTGVERMLVNLIAHVTRGASSSESLYIELSYPPGRVGPRIRIHGSALHVDDALRRVGGGNPSEPSQIEPGLWQVRCEALLQDIRLHLEGGELVLEVPPATLHGGATQTTGS